jgi:hypothetical protein
MEQLFTVGERKAGTGRTRGSNYSLRGGAQRRETEIEKEKSGLYLKPLFPLSLSYG